ncbi:MAG: zf-HC2 domain-containing protein [Candidatus Erginobacter occultus]|nr:zf-HC2 domain-containing protein [Candidatus Erginobacter occultus]
MKCEEITDLLSGYLDGELDEGERKRVEEHLSVCPACAEELRALRGCVEGIGSLEEVEPPADFLSRVHDRLEKKPGLKTALGKIFVPLPLRIPLEAAAAAAVVILVVYLVKRPLGSLPDQSVAVPADGLKQEKIDAFRPDSGLWAVRGISAEESKQEELYARAEISEPAVELVLLVEPGTGFPGEADLSRSRMKAAASRQLEAPERRDAEQAIRADPPPRLEDLVAREGGEIVSREVLADGTRRLVIQLPPDRCRPFRESLSRISDLPPALPGEELETFRFHLTAE